MMPVRRKLLFDAAAALRAVPPTPDAVREAFRHVEQPDWNFLYEKLGYGGEASYWRAVFTDVETALRAAPSASAGPQAEGVAERTPKVRTSHHRNKEEAARLQALVDERYGRPQPPQHIGEYIADYSPLTPEQITREDPELTELYARSHPQPQQADGRGAVIDALTKIDTIAVCVGVVEPNLYKGMLSNIADIARAALQQTDGPAK